MSSPRNIQLGKLIMFYIIVSIYQGFIEGSADKHRNIQDLEGVKTSAYYLPKTYLPY